MLFPSAMMWIVFGSISAYMAKKRGRNPYLWFFLGTLFGVFGLLFLYFSPRDLRKASENPAASDPSTIDITPKASPSDKEKFWYYLDPENTQVGPMSYDGLLKDYQEGKVTRSTFVWNENYDAWKPFSDLL